MTDPTDHVDLLAQQAELCDAVERRWFMETFWPEYDKVVAVARDLIEPANHPQFADTGHSRISPDGNNRLAYSTTEVCRKHGVSPRWIGANVSGFLQEPQHQFVRNRRQAANNYAVYLGRLHPRMPLQRVTELVNVFVPDYLEASVRRALQAADLYGDGRRASNEAVKLYKNTIHHEIDIEEFMDSLYEGDEHDGTI